jgi:hypothetical protein
MNFDESVQSPEVVVPDMVFSADAFRAYRLIRRLKVTSFDQPPADVLPEMPTDRDHTGGISNGALFGIGLLTGSVGYLSNYPDIEMVGGFIMLGAAASVVKTMLRSS